MAVCERVNLAKLPTVFTVDCACVTSSYPTCLRLPTKSIRFTGIDVQLSQHMKFLCKKLPADRPRFLRIE